MAEHGTHCHAVSLDEHVEPSCKLFASVQAKEALTVQFQCAHQQGQDATLQGLACSSTTESIFHANALPSGCRAYQSR